MDAAQSVISQPAEHDEVGHAVLANAIRFLARYIVRTRLNPFVFQNARNLIAADPPVPVERGQAT